MFKSMKVRQNNVVPDLSRLTGHRICLHSMCRPLPKWEFKDFLGWMDQGDDKQAYGIFIQNGRLKGDMKKALRRVIERYELPVRITPNQNLILCDIEESWKADIISTLSTAGVRCVMVALCGCVHAA